MYEHEISSRAEVVIGLLKEAQQQHDTSRTETEREYWRGRRDGLQFALETMSGREYLGGELH